MFRMPRPVRAVFVVDGIERADVVRSLRAAGDVAVAFSGTDAKAGALLAQQCGARFYLVGEDATLESAIDRARAHWEKIPFEVSKS